MCGWLINHWLQEIAHYIIPPACCTIRFGTFQVSISVIACTALGDSCCKRANMKTHAIVAVTATSSAGVCWKTYNLAKLLMISMCSKLKDIQRLSKVPVGYIRTRSQILAVGYIMASSQILNITSTKYVNIVLGIGSHSCQQERICCHQILQDYKGR